MLATVGARAATIDILWYDAGSGIGGGTAGYHSAMNPLIAQAAANTVNNTWNITWWDGGAKPAGSFDVLVSASEAGFGVNNSALISSGLNSSSFGDRVFLTGQDADYHYVSGNGTPFNSAQGFIIDAINWAGSGTGLGLVSLSNDYLSGLFTGFTHANGGGNDVLIPGAVAANPVNQGLTSAGLSNWSSSYHDTFTGLDSSMWTGINVNNAGNYVTIVSAATAGGGTSGSVPDGGSTMALLGLAMTAVAGARRKFGI